MANTDGPFGLRWVGSVDGATRPPVFVATIPAATAVGVGSVVVVSNAGVIGLAEDATLGTNNLVLGVAAGYKAQVTAAEAIPLIRPNGQIFEAQAEQATWGSYDTIAEHLTAAYAGTTFGFAGGATISSANVSGLYVDLDTPTDTDITTIFELTGMWSTRPDNDITSNYANVHVRFYNDSVAAGLTVVNTV